MEQVRKMQPDPCLADVGMEQVYLAQDSTTRLGHCAERAEDCLFSRLLNSIYAAMGDNKKALDALQEALAKGYGDFASRLLQENFGILLKHH